MKIQMDKTAFIFQICNYKTVKSYLIVSLMDKDEVVLKGFNIFNQQVLAEKLIIGGE